MNSARGSDTNLVSVASSPSSSCAGELTESPSSSSCCANSGLLAEQERVDARVAFGLDLAFLWERVSDDAASLLSLLERFSLRRRCRVRCASSRGSWVVPFGADLSLSASAGMPWPPPPPLSVLRRGEERGKRGERRLRSPGWRGLLPQEESEEDAEADLVAAGPSTPGVTLRWEPPRLWIPWRARGENVGDRRPAPGFRSEEETELAEWGGICTCNETERVISRSRGFSLLEVVPLSLLGPSAALCCPL
mmetsp:Transcript_13052/g.39471  ORF Transcript_13052/g.39471 Transcript_13052/m.39471 type:complete len:250 (-) Transcript_13052:1916-2665(-)